MHQFQMFIGLKPSGCVSAGFFEYSLMGGGLRTVCNAVLLRNFIRIRAGRIFLVHETAKTFLLDTQPLNSLGIGYYLRPFRWRIERPTTAELKHVKHRKAVDQKHSSRLGAQYPDGCCNALSPSSLH